MKKVHIKSAIPIYIAAAVWLVGTGNEHVPRQHGKDRAVRLVADIALQAETGLDAAGMDMRGDPGAHGAEVPERQQRDAVHAMRAQINDAPGRAVLVEDRFGLDALRVAARGGVRPPVAVLCSFPHDAHILPQMRGHKQATSHETDARKKQGPGPGHPCAI